MLRLSGKSQLPERRFPAENGYCTSCRRIRMFVVGHAPDCLDQQEKSFCWSERNSCKAC